MAREIRRQLVREDVIFRGEGGLAIAKAAAHQACSA